MKKHVEIKFIGTGMQKAESHVKRIVKFRVSLEVSKSNFMLYPELQTLKEKLIFVELN